MKSPVIGLSLSAALLIGLVGCEKKLSPEAIQAQETAKKADDRVAALEKQLQELKEVKPAPAAQPATTNKPAAKPIQHNNDAEHIAKAHAKALEKQLAEAKAAAEAKKKAAQAAAQMAPAAKPIVSVEVPAGTEVSVRLAKDISTETAQAGEGWSGTLNDTITVEGKTIWPAGTPVRGVVTQSTPAGRLSNGNGGLGIKLTFVGSHDVEAGTHLVVGTARGERNAKYIGGAAALGALVGILSDKENKNDHALGGAAIGAAVGTAAAAASADTAIKIEAAKPIKFKLTASEKIILK